MAKAETVPESPVTLRLTRRFAAPREAVFRAWTEPDRLTQWFGPEGVNVRDVRIDLRPGGRYSLVMFETDGSTYPLSGEYREIAPPERLVFTWVWERGDFAGIETLVTLELSEDKDGTLLTLIHERLPGERARALHEEGWTSTLVCLERGLNG